VAEEVERKGEFGQERGQRAGGTGGRRSHDEKSREFVSE